MTTAFVLSGGGSLGAVQVGMLQALASRGVRPDLLVGSSVGAVNAAFLAGHGAGEEAVGALAALWAGLRRTDVFPFTLRHQLLAAAGARSALFSNAALRRLLTAHLTYPHLDAARVPVHVVATDVLTGEEVLLSDGDVVSAVLASTAIPGLLPSVERGGLTLVDGGLADNAAISQAVALAADRIFVLPTGFACALSEPPATPHAAALHALSLLTQQRLVHEVRALADRADLHVLPPLCPLAVSPGDFRHASQLIDRARRATGSWLDEGRDRLPHQERFLALHGHASLAPRADRTHA